MDTLELNKVAAAALCGGIAFFLTGLIGENLVHVTPLKEPAIKIDVTAGPGAPAAPQAEPPISALLVSADPKKGQALTQQLGCVACHSFNDGGKSGIGPNLYGVVGAPHGHEPGFAYSAALKGVPGNWTYEALNDWLKKPAAYAPGTKMTFAGIADPQKRADVIAYLHTLSANPVPYPPPPAASAAPAAGAPAQAAAAPAGGPAAQAAAAPPESFDSLVASADPAKGRTDTQKLGCVACHSFNEGGKAGVGPNLYGIVGAPHGHMAGYAYSAALKAKQGDWTVAELDQWLTKPSGYAPGNKMTFAGVPDAKTRAEVIKYLATLSPAAEPVPAAAADAPPAAAQPPEPPAK